MGADQTEGVLANQNCPLQIMWYQLRYSHSGCSLLWFTWLFFFPRWEKDKKEDDRQLLLFIYLLLDKVLSYKLGPAMQLKRLCKSINFKLNQPRNVCWIYEFLQILLVYEIPFISYFAGQSTVTYKNKLEKCTIAQGSALSVDVRIATAWYTGSGFTPWMTIPLPPLFFPWRRK